VRRRASVSRLRVVSVGWIGGDAVSRTELVELRSSIELFRIPSRLRRRRKREWSARKRLERGRKGETKDELEESSSC